MPLLGARVLGVAEKLDQEVVARMSDVREMMMQPTQQSSVLRLRRSRGNERNP